MKKLLLHLGYPKCASTTLQNGLFYELHKRRDINFIGRAWESNYFGPADNKKDYKAWFQSVLIEQDEATKRRVRERTALDFRDDKLNLISEGLFLVRELHDDQLVNPEKVGEYFKSKVDETELLFVIRNQQTLIMSYFIQTYRNIEEKDFSVYLDKHVATTKQKDFKIFYFHNVIGRYAEVMGKDSVNIVFYEDLVSDRDAFQKDMGAVLGTAPDLVGDLIDTPHSNKTKKEVAGSVVKKLNRRSFGEKIQRFLATGDPRDAILSTPREKVVVPEVTDDQKALIFDAFKDSNEKLADEFGLDRDRMRRYGYF